MKFRKRIFALATAIVMLLQFAAFAEEAPALQTPVQENTVQETPEAETPAEEISAEDPMEKVTQYSNYMLKLMLKTYAKNIADDFYYGIKDEELLFAALCDTIDNGNFDIDRAVESMIGCLDDKYAEFYTREEYAAMTEEIAGEFSGIGVMITQSEDKVVVLTVYEDSPAEAGGVLEGDYIIAVNGQSTQGLTVNEVRNLVVGIAGTSVELTLKRGTREVTAICVRGSVTVKHTETKMLTDDIAYLKLTEFARTAPNEISQYISEIQSKRVKKLVIDLRNNPGGDLDAALAIARIFISAGKLAELRYNDPSQNKFVYSDNTHAPKLKIVVLVNEHSASASEFLAMAFKGRVGVKVLGTKTFGKGSMQALTRLLTGAGMKFTIGEFYSIKGERVNTVGITPDILVENEIIPVVEDEFVKIDFERVDEGANGGEMTLALEQRLYALGLTQEEPDEVFDEATSDAVKSLQAVEGYEVTGIPGFYEYLFLNDYSYENLNTVIDHQLDAAVEYLSKL